jgi:glycosyltransferase involved in cell wall biosynthesis
VKGKRVVFDSHEIYSKMLSSNVPGPLKSFVGFLEGHLSKYADRVIVTCEAMAKFYASLGVKKITVVGNFKDPAVFHIDRNILERRKYALGIKDELIICYIANLGPERIIKPLLDIVKRDDKLFLLIGGDGSQMVIVEQAAQESPRIKYLRHVRAEMVPLYTAISDVIYYGYDRMSEMAEFASPNKLFEALAAGKAFLGGDFGDMGRILKEENCGIALKEFNEITMKDAMAVLKDRERLSSYKNNAKKAGLGRYCWANAEAELLKAAALVSS